MGIRYKLRIYTCISFMQPPVICPLENGTTPPSPQVEAVKNRVFLAVTTPASDLRATVRKMQHRASGTDGWDACCLLQLPDEAFQQLVDLLTRIEAGAPWPAGLTHWRITFIPKTQETSVGPTDVLKVRPISIGPLLYRAYAKLRFAQLGQFLLSSLPDLQVGGLPNLSAEMLVLSLLNETSPTSHPFGVLPPPQV